MVDRELGGLEDMANDALITLIKKFESEPQPETARILKPLLDQKTEEIEEQIKTTQAQTFNGPDNIGFVLKANGPRPMSYADVENEIEQLTSTKRSVQDVLKRVNEVLAQG